MKSAFRIFFFLIIVNLVQAQNPGDYNIENWTTDNGLPQNTITDIYQTENGYLWLATYEGLVRFDGRQFVVFNPASDLNIKSSRLTKLYPFDTNSILISAEGGLWLLLKGRKFLNFNTEADLINYIFSQKMPGLNNYTDYFIFMTNRSIICLNNSIFSKNKITLNAKITIAHEGETGKIWFLTEDGFVHSLKDSILRSFKLPVIKSNIMSMCEDRNGRLWLGTAGDGLLCLDNNKWSVFGKREGFFTDFIPTIREDKKGILWFGTEQSGVMTFFENKVTSFSKENGILDNFIRKVFFDREGNIWLGTNIGGLTRLKEKRIKTLSMKDGLPIDIILSIHEDINGGIWIGTNGKGLSYYSNGKFKNFNTDKFFSKFIWSINTDSKGSKWFSSYGTGLLQLQNGKYNLYSQNNNLKSSFIRVIYEDSKKNLWIGTENSGLFIFDNGKFTNFTIRDGLPSNFVISILEDKKGALWIGTNGGGISHYKDGKFLTYSTDQGLSNNIVRSIYEDKEGILWFGTYGGGLNRLKDGKLIPIMMKDGLFDNVVHNIIEDNEDNFWMSCNKGIFAAKRSELKNFSEGLVHSVSCYSYGKSDGMLSDECNGGFQPSVCKTKRNELWYPTIGGIAIVDLNKVTKNTIPPPVEIEKVMVDSESFIFFDDLIIPPGKKSFEFHYAGLSLREPRKVRFKYRLQGFENDWVEAGNRRVAYYTNINPGDYEFQVIACNDDGIWNDQGSKIRFIVKPFFYQTLAFYISSAFFAIFLFIGFFRYRVRKLRKNQVILEKLIHERTIQLQIANATKDKLFSIIAHDLRNQIGNFMSIMQLLADDSHILTEDQSKEFLKRLSISSEKTYYLLENLLSWASSQRGTIDFKPEKIEINILILEVFALLSNNAGTKSVKLNLELNDAIYIFGDKNMILTVLRNLIMNAVKYSKQGGEIKVDVVRDTEMVKVVVSDDGIGIRDEDKDKLFRPDKNFTTKGTGGEKGTGLGLILCKEFIEKNNGKIWVESEYGKGSKFIFTLPYARDI